MKISAMTYTFDQQSHPAAKADLPHLVAQSGAAGINWVTGYGMPPEKVLEVTKQAGIEISCYTFAIVPLHLGEAETVYLADARRHFAYVRALGAPRVMVVPMPIPGFPDRNQARREWIRILKKLLPMAQDAGTVLTVENFQGVVSPFVTAADFLEAHAEIPELRLTLDSGNAMLGENPVHTIEATAGLVEFVHVKDWTVSDVSAPGCTPGLTGKFYTPALVGEGALPLPEILAALRQSGYDGWVDIEYEGKMPAETAIATVAARLRALPGNYFA